MRGLLLLPLLALCAYGQVSTSSARLAPASVERPQNYSPTAKCAVLDDYAQAANLAPGADWNCWEGEWDELELLTPAGDLSTWQQAHYPGNPAWEAFTAAMTEQYPDGVTVFTLDQDSRTFVLLYGLDNGNAGGYSGVMTK